MSETVLKHFDFEPPGWSEFATQPTLHVPYEAEVLVDQPISYLRLAENSGTVATDASGHGNHGSYVGQVLHGQSGVLHAGHGDTAIRLTGNGDYLMVGSGVIPSGNAARTVEAWFKVDGTPDSDTFFNCGAVEDGSQLTLDVSATSLAIDVGGHRCEATGLSLSGWHHLAVVLGAGASSSSDWLVYLDSEPLALVTVSGNPQAVNTNDSTVYVGRHLTTAASWGGWLDEIAIYDSAIPRRRLESHVKLAAVG